MHNLRRLAMSLVMFLAFLGVLQAGTITGYVYNSNNTPIKKPPVTIVAICPATMAEITRTPSNPDGSFSITVSNCASSTVTLNFYRGGTTGLPNTTKSVAANGPVAMGNVCINANPPPALPDCPTETTTMRAPGVPVAACDACPSQVAACNTCACSEAPPCRRGTFRLFRRCR